MRGRKVLAIRCTGIGTYYIVMREIPELYGHLNYERFARISAEF